jgi:hypothetical protein
MQTVQQMRAAAKQRGIKGYYKMAKAALASALGVSVQAPQAKAAGNRQAQVANAKTALNKAQAAKGRPLTMDEKRAAVASSLQKTKQVSMSEADFAKASSSRATTPKPQAAAPAARRIRGSVSEADFAKATTPKKSAAEQARERSGMLKAKHRGSAASGALQKEYFGGGSRATRAIIERQDSRELADAYDQDATDKALNRRKRKAEKQRQTADRKKYGAEVAENLATGRKRSFLKRDSKLKRGKSTANRVMDAERSKRGLPSRKAIRRNRY